MPVPSSNGMMLPARVFVLQESILMHSVFQDTVFSVCLLRSHTPCIMVWRQDERLDGPLDLTHLYCPVSMQVSTISGVAGMSGLLSSYPRLFLSAAIHHHRTHRYRNVEAPLSLGK